MMTTLLVAKQYIKLFYSKFAADQFPFGIHVGNRQNAGRSGCGADVLLYAGELYRDHVGVVRAAASVCI